MCPASSPRCARRAPCCAGTRSTHLPAPGCRVGRAPSAPESVCPELRASATTPTTSRHSGLSRPYHVERRLPTASSPGHNAVGEPFVDHDDARAACRHVAGLKRSASGDGHADGFEVVVGDEADHRARFGARRRSLFPSAIVVESASFPVSGRWLAAAANPMPLVPRKRRQHPGVCVGHEVVAAVAGSRQGHPRGDDAVRVKAERHLPQLVGAAQQQARADQTERP